jgi:DNA-binding response OmpR family regulator
MQKILTIDDSKISQALIADIFAGRYGLAFEENGPAGIAAARETAPDLILLDVHMPGMDGYDVCRILKGEPGLREIPVIFITTLDTESERVKGFEAGAEDYVVKPFYREELLARVRTHLDLHRARKQAVELERLKVFRELAVAISHEINNPLTSVYAFLYILQGEIADPSARVVESLEGVRSELKRMQRITERLAQASRVISTSYNRDVSMIDLHGI